MRVLVTGGRSLLAAQVARQLHGRGDEVRLMQRHPAPVAAELTLCETLGDITDPHLVNRALTGSEVVIHCAARVGINGSRAQFERTNVEGTRTLLRAARVVGVQRFVYVSSPSVAHAGRSLVGQAATPADPHGARGHYARSKAAAEQLVLAADAAGFATLAVRPHLVWGPGDQQLIGRVVQRARAGRLPLVGGGLALIDTTYLDNASDALVAAADRAEAGRGRAFVVSNGEPRTVAELLSEICGAAGVGGPRWRVPKAAAWGAGAASEVIWRVLARADEPPMTRFLAEQLSTAHWFDLRETERVLRWTPRVSLRAGFTNLNRYFAEQTEAAARVG
ncbi:MAG: NAD-dependent epimerase/dehydratase family protein [Candidatus Nanopelagicales bacterium]